MQPLNTWLAAQLDLHSDVKEQLNNVFELLAIKTVTCSLSVWFYVHLVASRNQDENCWTLSLGLSCTLDLRQKLGETPDMSN